MKFARMEMLFLVWLLPVLLLVMVYGFRRRKKILSRFAFGKGLAFVSAQADMKRRWIKCGLILIALLFVIFSLMGPQYGYRWQEIEQKGIDIIVALDCSKSMAATDIKPSRLDRAKREIFDLLGMLKGDRIGLVAFAGTAFLQCPLTLDYETFYLFLNTLTPDFLPVGGTDMALALKTAVSGFNDTENSEKAVILITDGDNTGDDPLKQAQTAKESGIKVFCIGVGKNAGVPIPNENGGFKKDRSGKIVVTKLDEDLLKQVVAVTNGVYVRSVAGDLDLETIYENEIRQKMETTTLSSGKKRIWEDRFQWFLWIAVAAFLTEIFLPSKKAIKPLLLLCAFCFFVNPSIGYAKNTYETVQKGLKAYGEGNYEIALKHFIDAQLEEPDKPENYYNIGNTYYKLGDYDSAIRNYSQVLDSQNEILKQKTHFNMGNAKYRKQMLTDSMKEYKEALRLDPNDQKAKDNLEFVKKMAEQEKNKQPQGQSQKSEKDQNQDQAQDRRQKGQDNEQQKKGEKRQRQDENNQESSEESSKSQNKDTPTEYGDEMTDISGGSEKQNHREEDAQHQKEERTPKKPTPMDEDYQAQQAERMLNRLKDEPGKAMIPSYTPREIEKDW